MLLYNSPVSGNCYKVRLLCAHLGLPLELREVDVVDRSDPRTFLDGLSPSHRVPTLVLDDGRPLAESGAILWYLGEGTRFVPDDPYERAQVLQWMFFEQYDHEPAIAVARFLITYSQLPREQYEKRLPRMWADGERALAAMDAHLDGRAWFVGDAMTIADIALYAYTHAAEEAELDLAPFGHVRAWLDRVAAEPGHVAIDA
ncbi:MAG TPA: glutathione S-transferase family protein [Gaiellaceae bacterium]|nr:glutathione S-transferase family protein [Gaiellaceae bacterium]